MSSEKATVLFVDDEERILRSMKMMFRGQYNLLSTTDGNEALEMVANQRVHVVVSDQRMPKMLGVDLLASVKSTSPNTMRILLTGYSDLAAIIGSVNQGEIYRYVNKPWVAEELKHTVAEAVDIAMEQFSMLDPVAPARDARNDTGILVIDSDEQTYLEVKRMSPGLPVHWGRDLDEAFDLLEKNNIGVAVTEIRDHGRDYSDAIKQLKRYNPALVTIVASAYDDGVYIIGLINEGQVFRYHPKPLRLGMLSKNIESALAYHYRLKANPVLSKRHKVERSRKSGGTRLSARVMGYFRRLNGATAS